MAKFTIYVPEVWYVAHVVEADNLKEALEMADAGDGDPDMSDKWLDEPMRITDEDFKVRQIDGTFKDYSMTLDGEIQPDPMEDTNNAE